MELGWLKSSSRSRHLGSPSGTSFCPRRARRVTENTKGLSGFLCAAVQRALVGRGSVKCDNLSFLRGGLAQMGEMMGGMNGYVPLRKGRWPGPSGELRFDPQKRVILQSNLFDGAPGVWRSCQWGQPVY